MAGVSGSYWVSLIKSIQITNFKKFGNFSISCKKTNILTGPNNAGKSSVLDALRITADIMRFTYRKKPGRKNFAEVGVCAYYNPPHSAISVPIRNIAKDYSDDPASVTIAIDSGAKLHFSLHPDKAIEVFLEADGALPTTGMAFRKLFDLDLCIVPTLGPFDEFETYLTDATVESNQNTRRAARNFRNIAIRMSEDDFQEYQSLVETTWPGVRLQKAERDNSSIIMMYEEGRIPREIYWSGFGLQMWFQMLMQIMRGNETSIFVLDEPDIYLHADVQRRLLNICQIRFGQLFLATHSTEIINEANPGDILIVKKEARSAKRVTNEKSYKELFQYLGSSENAEFARVSRANRIVFFEGNDRKILRKFAQKSRVGISMADTDTVFMKVGGFGQWQRVTHASWTLSELFDMDVKIVALFDSDYRSDAEVEDFLNNPGLAGVCCRVLKRKEIENYCLNQASITRELVKEAAARGGALSAAEVEEILFDVTSEFELETASNRAGQRITFARRNGAKESDASITKSEMIEFKEKWKTLGGRFDLIGGKSFISELSRYTQKNLGFSLSVSRLIDQLRVDEIDADLVEILSDFDDALLGKAPEI